MQQNTNVYSLTIMSVESFITSHFDVKTTLGSILDRLTFAPNL
jgi:hypothetical protein